MDLSHLEISVVNYEAGQLDADALALQWRRALPELGSGLSPDLLETAEALLMRVESARWFSGEACGFSSRDLAIALRRWLDMARASQPAGASTR